MNTIQSTAVRRYPAKPVRRQSVQVSRQAETDEVMELFNAFVSEARKELRKRKQLTLQGRMNETNCDQVTFMGETFCLTIDFVGGIAV